MEDFTFFCVEDGEAIVLCKMGLSRSEVNLSIMRAVERIGVVSDE